MTEKGKGYRKSLFEGKDPVTMAPAMLAFVGFFFISYLFIFSSVPSLFILPLVKFSCKKKQL